MVISDAHLEGMMKSIITAIDWISDQHGAVQYSSAQKEWISADDEVMAKVLNDMDDVVQLFKDTMDEPDCEPRWYNNE